MASITQVVNDLMLDWDGTVPISVETLAARHGLDCSLFNHHTDPLRRRYAIAHALGHFVLGHESTTVVCGVGCFSKSIINAQERAANQFVLELLIPDRSLVYAVTVLNITEVQKLAKLFGVSTVALGEKLKQVFPDVFE